MKNIVHEREYNNMTDDNNGSNNYKNLINKILEANSAFENIRNSSVINSARALSNSLSSISSKIPPESLRRISEAATAAAVNNLSNSFVINPLPIDSLLFKDTENLSKTIKDASNSIAFNNIKITEEALSNLSRSLVIDSLPIDLSLTESMQELVKTMEDVSNSMGIDNIRMIKETVANLSNSLAIDSLPFENIQKIANTVQEMALTIPNFSESITTIDWDTTNLTEEDVKEAQGILGQEDIELIISQELDKHKEITQLSNPVLIIILIFKFLLSFINSVETTNLVIEVANHAIIPAIESVASSELKNKMIPMKHVVKKVHHMLKEKLPLYILTPLGIVIKKGLKVHKKKRLDSPVKGNLDALVVVKIIKQDRNWIYISLEDSAGNSILKGWTLTRYIKKIK